MNYYKHYIGDFQRDTGHLSLTERGAYLALIHHYYATELPLPNSVNALCRIAGALTKPEQAAVTAVMAFFDVVESGLMHKRIEAELEKHDDRADKNRAIAVQREATRRAKREHETGTNRAQNVHETLHETLHETSTNDSPTRSNPITNIQEPSPIVPKGTVNRFPEFWLAWPATSPGRKTGKAACEKKWRSNNLDALADLVLNHVAAMKQTRKWQDGFEPAPMTFLNQKHWLDGDVTQAAPAWAGAK